MAPSSPLVLFNCRIWELRNQITVMGKLADISKYLSKPDDLHKRSKTDLGLLACNLGLQTHCIDDQAEKLVQLSNEDLAHSIDDENSMPIHEVMVKSYGAQNTAGYIVLVADDLKHTYIKLPSFVSIEEPSDLLEYRVWDHQMVHFTNFCFKQNKTVFATICRDIGLKACHNNVIKSNAQKKQSCC